MLSRNTMIYVDIWCMLLCNNWRNEWVGDEEEWEKTVYFSSILQFWILLHTWLKYLYVLEIGLLSFYILAELHVVQYECRV
jgi:hypothetical protein